MSAPIDDEAVAAADKEMEERALRAKELLSQRYKGLKKNQVCACVVFSTKIQSPIPLERVLAHSLSN